MKTNLINKCENGVMVDLGLKVADVRYKVDPKIENHKYFRYLPIEAKDFETLGGYSGYNHGFLEACHRAFKDHVPLEIRPDNLWLMICQAVSLHEEKSKILGKVFNLPKKKKTIVIEEDSFVKGSPNNNWVGTFGKFDEKIRENVPETLYNLIANKKYSTTTKLDQTCFIICLMDSLKNYFSYCCRTKCYIPQIYVKGTKEDWKKMYSSIFALSNSKIGLDWWWPILLDITQKFIDLYDGKAKKEFWNSVYKYRGAQGSGGVPTISGWICAFFPYVKVSSGGYTHPGWTEKAMGNKRWMELFEEYKKKSWHGKHMSGIVMCEKIPSGINAVPFLWEYLGSKIKMKFYGGFMGCKQDEKTFALSARVGWAVGDEIEKSKTRY